MRRPERKPTLKTTKLAHLVLALSLVSGIAIAAELEVKLTVREAGGAARKAEPVCGGVPLPWGVYREDQKFVVLKGGEAIPAQVLPHVVDEKGFLRWVLVDTRVDVPANGKAELTLKTGDSFAPATPLKVDNGDAGITVDTGNIRFAIRKSEPFSLFSSVACGGPSTGSGQGRRVVEGGEVSYTDATNKDDMKTYKAGPPESLELYNAGPMRATIKVEGRFVGDDQTRMRYIAWITCWAGHSRVHAKYVLSNSNPEQFTFRMIKDSVIRMKLSAGGDAAGKEGMVSAGGVSAQDLYYEVQPRTVNVAGGNLVLKGITGREDADGGKIPFQSRHYLLMDSSHHSSQYMFDFAGGELAPAAGRNPMHILAPMAWYSETEGLAVGRFGSQADELKCYKQWNWSYREGRIPKGTDRRFNPRPGNRYVHTMDNHYNTEQDNTEAVLLMYLRTGIPDCFAQGQAWANFRMDRGTFRTDGWLFKDGGVWWNKNGPSWGHSPTRTRDPVTGIYNWAPNAWAHKKKRALGQMAMSEADFKECDNLSDSKTCNCHSYAAGLALWFCLTGERDALEAAIDVVEQTYNDQNTSHKKVPGESNEFSRDFTRSCYLAAAVRLADPRNEFVQKVEDFYMQVYTQRPNPELRGMVPAPGLYKGCKWKGIATLRSHTAGKGEALMKEHGVSLPDPSKPMLRDSEGRSWQMVINPHIWMNTYLSAALECSYRQSGNEDVMDHCIAYGQAASKVFFQPKHYNLDYMKMLVDFPRRGIAQDAASWASGDDIKMAEGIELSGSEGQKHPDVVARAYSLTGEKHFKQRAYDYWWGGSHRKYKSKKMEDLNSVALWVNIVNVHSETVRLTGRTFYEWSHPREDEEAPAAITDLAVTVEGDGSTGLTAGKATVSFTAPADNGSGRLARYQVKCSDRKIVDYDAFLKIYNEFREKDYCNWFLAKNLHGEPAPKAPGVKESFTVTGVPAGAKFFAVRVFDDSSNRSGLSNVVEAE